MTTAAKVIITISLCIVVLLVGVISAGIYLTAKYGAPAFEAATRAATEGTEEGKKTDNRGCLEQALERHKSNQSIGGAIATNVFLTQCLGASRPTPGFCDDVPKPTEFTKSAEYQIRKCKEAGFSDQYCAQIFAAVQQYCERNRPLPKSVTVRE